MDFRAFPYVCGAIGRWTPEALQRLRDASPGPLHQVHQSPSAALWATGPVSTWGDGERRGFYWAPLASGAAPVSWRGAAQDRLAAGLAIEGPVAILHTCAIGFQELYVRRLGDALYFAMRIDPLVGLDSSPLHVDWSAWASILAMTSPLADETPFQEVRRLIGATGWSARGEHLEPVGFEPAWLGVTPDGGVDLGELIDRIAAQIPSDDKTVELTLSGGWDSRLLAILARRKTAAIHAWTTSNDDGRDVDIQYARRVARELELTHRVLVPEPEAWVSEHSVVRRRIEYQTTHHIWLMPLARELHVQLESRPLLDGLAGDVLLKNLFVDREVVEAPSDAERRRLQWDKLAQRRLEQPRFLLRPIAAAFEEMSRHAFDRAVRVFDGHPAAATMAVLTSRTTRAIGPSPQWILGPEVSVRMPFIHPEVVAAALRVPVHAKLDGAIYREVLHRASPSVAALPSTNHKDVRLPPARARRQSSPAALACMAESIVACRPLRGVLNFEFILALKLPFARELIARNMGVRRLMSWASLFADWHAMYSPRLDPKSLTPAA